MAAIEKPIIKRRKAILRSVRISPPVTPLHWFARFPKAPGSVGWKGEVEEGLEPGSINDWEDIALSAPQRKDLSKKYIPHVTVAGSMGLVGIKVKIQCHVKAAVSKKLEIQAGMYFTGVADNYFVYLANHNTTSWELVGSEGGFVEGLPKYARVRKLFTEDVDEYFDGDNKVWIVCFHGVSMFSAHIAYFTVRGAW